MANLGIGIFYFGLSVLVYSMSKKQEIMTYNLKKKQSIETDLQMNYMFELADKDFKITIINMLKRSKMNERIENLSRGKKTFKNKTIKNTTSKMKSKLDRLTNRMDTTEEKVTELKGMSTKLFKPKIGKKK